MDIKITPSFERRLFANFNLLFKKLTNYPNIIHKIYNKVCKEKMDEEQEDQEQPEQQQEDQDIFIRDKFILLISQ